MGYFPFFIDIENKNCLIVGGGEVALRKIKKLIPYRPDIYVVAKSICEEISNINYPRLFIHKREFLDEDIKNQFFVIAATDDFSLNHRIAELCRSKKLLVNVVDSKDDCGFIFPSLFKRGNLSVGISSSGISPDLSVYYRKYTRFYGRRACRGETAYSGHKAQKNLLERMSVQMLIYKRYSGTEVY